MKNNLLTLGLEMGAWPFKFWSSKEVWHKTLKEQNPQRATRKSLHRAWLPNKGVATLPRQKHLRISTAGPIPRKAAGRRGEQQVYGPHRTTKFQYYGKIIYIV